MGDAKLLKAHLEMTAPQLIDRLVESVVETGLKRFDAIVVDDRVFDRQFVHPSWPRDQLNRWFCAEVAGLNFNDNCIDVTATPTRSGLSPRIRYFPSGPFIEAANRSKTGAENTFWISRKQNTNQITFRGLVYTQRPKPYTVTFHDPPMVLGRLLAHRLAQRGIVVGRVIRPGDGDAPLTGRPLHVVRTTLPLVLTRTNRDSQNLFAEALLKRLGHQVTGTPGSFENGAAAIRIYLHEALGPRSAVMAIHDGSGMSRDNRVTTRLMTRLLRRMHDSSAAGVYRESLAYSGRDAAGQQLGAGTFKGRFDDLDPGSWVFGKSGYLRGVSAVSGYLVVPDHTAPGQYRVVAFSFIFNGFRPPLSNLRLKRLQDQMIGLVEDDLVPQTAGAR